MPKTLSVTMIALLLAGGACKKKQEPNAAPDTADPKVASGESGQAGQTAAPAEKPATPDPAAAAPDKEATDKAAAAAEQKRKDAEEAAADLRKAQEESQVEIKRWTPDLHKKAAALAAKKFPSAKAALQAIVASPHRLPGNSKRDRYRHPVETLTFFGIQPSMTVVEVGSGGGWYTELLAPLLTREGKLVAMTFDPKGSLDSERTVTAMRLQMFLGKSPELFDKVSLAIVDPPRTIELGPPGSADLAVAAREMHNWQRSGQIDAYLAAVHSVLKDGGKFGVEQHRAAPGGKAEETAEKGYLPEEWLIKKVEAAGFKLEEKSEVNANPKDTKDYEQGVWTLPPTYALGDKDKAKYTAIGESDRMTLRFVKVAASAK